MVNVFVALGRGFKTVKRGIYDYRIELIKGLLTIAVAAIGAKADKIRREEFDATIDSISDISFVSDESAEIGAINELSKLAGKEQSDYYKQQAAEKIFRLYKDHNSPSIRAIVARHLAQIAGTAGSDYYKNLIFDYATRILK